MSSTGDSTPSPPSAANCALENIATLMGFDATEEFQNFVESAVVQDPFDEFERDFLTTNRATYAEPDFNAVTRTIGAYQALGQAEPQLNRYAAENPDKRAWAVHHHFARFIVRSHTLARTTDCDWPGATEDDFAVVAWQLYELLLFLIHRWMVQNPASESPISERVFGP